jgi:hypothetical protein
VSSHGYASPTCGSTARSHVLGTVCCAQTCSHQLPPSEAQMRGRGRAGEEMVRVWECSSVLQSTKLSWL